MKSMAEERFSKAIIKEKESEERIKLAETEIKSLRDCVAYFDANMSQSSKQSSQLRGLFMLKQRNGRRTNRCGTCTSLLQEKMTVLRIIAGECSQCRHSLRISPKD